MQQQNNLQKQLVQAILDSLNNHIPSNATFLAERLLAEKDTEEYRNLLAQAYLNQNKPYKAYHILKQTKTDNNKFKFALACFKINKIKEAEKALLPLYENPLKIPFSHRYDNIPNGSYGLYLLGLITQRHQKFIEAKQYYLKALQLNPTLWVAYQKLSKLGETVLPNKIFLQSRMKNYESNRKKNNAFNIFKWKNQWKDQQKKQDQYKRSQEFKFKKIDNQIKKKENNKHSLDFTSLLRRLAQPFYCMSSYQCTQAIKLFNQLPQNHFNTGWVLSNIGKCYMEIVKYQQAQKAFAQAYKLQPHRLQGIQYYSSCLWHLKKQVDLCYLAHSALQKSLYSAQTWIAVGNCFSLQKEHESALKFFGRAIQLNPNNPYAHSLCGHECVYNEDFKRAIKCFESALNLDVRHYNAWWGLGNIYYKQQKWQKAAQNFHKAISINSNNPVLHSFLGMTLAANRTYMQALKYFNISNVPLQKLDPKNGLNRFQKANTLVKLEDYKGALLQLQKLQTMMPKQAPILMLMGKIYKKQGDKQKAHQYFTLALDLQSKDAQRIKGLIESLHTQNNEFCQEIDI